MNQVQNDKFNSKLMHHLKSFNGARKNKTSSQIVILRVFRLFFLSFYLLDSNLCSFKQNVKL